MIKSFISLVFVIFFIAPALHAMDLTTQSSSDIKWKSIENDFVKVIYPDFLKDRAIYVANLIEHYSASVGLSFDIHTPQKVTLVLRAETADPNGFVTLGPRRTEWNTGATYTPIVGSLEWYQILSIHEYRHVQQNDAFLRGGVRYFDYLFGDFGQSIASAISKRSWQAEGDAVWAETKFSDGGRGRSPRFLSRLKGILLGSEIPTYDQFISGSYRDSLVNQYVYGYILIVNGYKKFGDDFWGKVSDKTAAGPHPWRFASSFKAISGQDFDAFYYETFFDLRQQWSADSFPELPRTEYSEANMPGVVDGNLYYVKYDLNSYAAIYKKTAQGEEVKIREIPFQKDLIPVDFKKNLAVYSEFVPDKRFGFKGSSDLVIVDLTSGKAKTITQDKRYYNPHFNFAGDGVIAAEFTLDEKWQLTVLDLEGHPKQVFKLPELKLLEGAYLTEDKIIVIANDSVGMKSLIEIDLATNKYEILIPASRNLLYSVKTDGKQNVLFEAPYLGATEVFKFNTADKSLAKCTQSRLGAYNPNFDGENFVYSEETPYGTRVQKQSLSQCTALAIENVVDFKYLSNKPSDNYGEFTKVDFPEQKSMYTKNADKYQEQDYGSFNARAFTPHSWNFFAARGFGLQVQTDNYLNDFGSVISLGSDGEENVPYSYLSIDYKKYFVIGSLIGDMRRRQTESLNTTDLTDWKEDSYGLQLILPYTLSNHLYHGGASLAVSGEHLSTHDYEFNDVDLGSSFSGEYFKTSVVGNFAFEKNPKFRSIISPWGVAALIGYDSVDGSNQQSSDTSRVYGNLKFNNPGFADNDGFQWEFSGENYSGYSAGSYRFTPPTANPLSYIYSRGYQYKAAEKFGKASANYLIPVLYPDWNLGSWWYLKRNYLNFYFDHTKATQDGLDKNMNSYGAELYFESVAFRFLPLVLGIRYIEKVAEKTAETNLFIATNLGLF